MKQLVLLIALPLLAAFLLPVVNRVSSLAGRYLGQAVLLLTTLIGVFSWGDLSTGPVALQMGGFRPPLGITLYIDQLALALAIAISLGTLLLWPQGEEQRIKKATLSLLLAGSGSGLALSGDLFNIYVFYELVAVVSYGLIAARGTAAAYAATLRYVVISGVGAAMALAGIALIYQATGTLNLAHLAQLAPEKLNNMQGLSAFVLLLIGFGVKAELFPMNAWVPEVYATASSRVSALLAGVVSKLALLIVLRLLVLIFQQAEALQIMLVLGMLGIISGELAAWRARDLNRMLAFSSIGQLGVMFVAFSIPGPAGVFAGIAVALHHMIIKPAFFMLASRWGGSLQKLNGAAGVSPLGAAIFVLLGLSLIGVPPLPGFWAKMLVVMSLFQQASSLYWLGAAAILAAAVLEVSYLFRVASSMYIKSGDAEKPPAPPGYELMLATVLGLVLLISMLMMGPLSGQLQTIANGAADAGLYIDTVRAEGLR